MHPRLAQTTFAALLALLAWASSAEAAIPEIFGIGSDSAGRAGAATATAWNYEALHYNPAGLAAAPDINVTLGVHLHGSLLRSEEEHFPISHPLAFLIGAVAPVPLGGWLEGRVTVGLLIVVLPTDLLVVRVHEPEQPQFPFYDNTTQRIVAEPGLAFEIIDGLSIGLAVDGFTGLAGFVSAAEDATRAVEPTVVVTTPATASVHLGARWSPTPHWTIGLAYRSPFDVPITIASDTSTAGFPINVDEEAHPFAAPAALAAGVAFRTGPLELSLDGTYERWSRVPAPFVIIDTELAGGIVLPGSTPDADYHDTFEGRAGFAWSFGKAGGPWGIFRAGYGIDPTPTPEQTGRTNLLDTTRHIITVGGGLRLRGIKGRPIRFDLHLGAHLVPRRVHTKDPDRPCDSGGLCDGDLTTKGPQFEDNPGWPSISGGGAVLFGGFQVSVAL